jgi:hypothetical protein
MHSFCFVVKATDSTSVSSVPGPPPGSHSAGMIAPSLRANLAAGRTGPDSKAAAESDSARILARAPGWAGSRHCQCLTMTMTEPASEPELQPPGSAPFSVRLH